MSNLDQAVQAEIDEYRPQTAPAFDTLVGRRHARIRRRLTAGGAALSAVAVVAAATLAPSLGGGGRDELPTVAAPPAPTGPAIRDDLDALVERCLKGYTATPAPRFVGMTEAEVFPPNVDYTTRPLARDGVCSDWRLVADGHPYLVLEDGKVVWAGTLTAPQEVSEETLPVPAEPSGATICADSPPDGGCRLVNQAQARELATALGTAPRARKGAVQCFAMPISYVVTFAVDARPADPVYTVPSVCAPAKLDGTSYDVDRTARDLVARLYQSAGVPPIDSVQSGTAPQPVVLERYTCGLLPLAFQGQEWVRPPFSPHDPPADFSGDGTATRKDNVLTYTDRLGAVIIFVPRDPAQPPADCA